MLSELEAGLGYTFRDRSILENALTHSSYANENRERGLHDNERLEFLGDSILGFVVADYLYRNFPDKPEGELTRIRADLVCEKIWPALRRPSIWAAICCSATAKNTAAAASATPSSPTPWNPSSPRAIWTAAFRQPRRSSTD